MSSCDQGTCADLLTTGPKKDLGIIKGKSPLGLCWLLLRSPLSPAQPGHPSTGSPCPSSPGDGDRPHPTHCFSSVMSSVTPAASKRTWASPGTSVLSLLCPSCRSQSGGSHSALEVPMSLYLVSLVRLTLLLPKQSLQPKSVKP